MTPATPPRSRSRRPTSSQIETLKLHLGPETPLHSKKEAIPVTPATISVKQIGKIEKPVTFSPSKCLKTPEYTPHRSKPNFQSNVVIENPGLKPVSRILFPSHDTEQIVHKCQEGLPGLSDDDISRLLLPPQKIKILESTSRGSCGEQINDCDYRGNGYDPTLFAKQVPGTPTDKIITFQLAEDWNNNSGVCISSDDEGEKDIINSEYLNPFLCDKVADNTLRNARRKELISKEPDITNSITYLDKNGKLVQKRELTPDEQERFKPKMLFKKELNQDKG